MVMVMIINEKSLCPSAHVRRSALRGSLESVHDGGQRRGCKPRHEALRRCRDARTFEHNELITLSNVFTARFGFFYTSYIVIVIRPAFVFINNLTKRAVYIFCFIATTTSIHVIMMIIIIIVYTVPV